MGQLQQRIIALSGAIVFFLSIIGLTVVVIFTMIQENKNADTNPAQDPTAAANACQAPTEGIETLAEPEAFVAEADVTELQTTDIEDGTGEAAKTGDCLVVKYYGTLASNGEKFDGNFTDPTAFAFTLGQGQVIQGWDEGLVGMKEGGVRRIVIPSDKAYGEQSPSEQIPANSDLVFQVKLLEVKEVKQ